MHKTNFTYNLYISNIQTSTQNGCQTACTIQNNLILYNLIIYMVNSRLQYQRQYSSLLCYKHRPVTMFFSVKTYFKSRKVWATSSGSPKIVHGSICHGIKPFHFPVVIPFCQLAFAIFEIYRLLTLQLEPYHSYLSHSL